MTAIVISERDLQNAIVQAAHLYGYMVFHARPALSAKGWRTAVQYDGTGFPDLVMVGKDRIVFAEIKSDKGKPSPTQEQWLAGLELVARAISTVMVCVWRPDDWPDRVLEVLQGTVTEQPLCAHVVAESDHRA